MKKGTHHITIRFAVDMKVPVFVKIEEELVPCIFNYYDGSGINVSYENKTVDVLYKNVELVDDKLIITL